MFYLTHEEVLEEERSKRLQALDKLLISLNQKNKKWAICSQVLKRKIINEESMTQEDVHKVLVCCILSNL